MRSQNVVTIFSVWIILLQTDHKPLKVFFANELPDIENTRLCRYREYLTDYNFDITWREGKTNHIADALLRAPMFPQDETDADGFVDVSHAITT